MNTVAENIAPIELYAAVRARGHPEWGTGEVLKIAQDLGVYQVKVLFRTAEGERLETVPLDWLEKASDLWQRLAAGDFDEARSYRLKQMAYDMAYANSGGELTASRVDLLPHQILLVHDLVAQSPRRMLIADEVGLGKTIETGMLIRELIARGDAERILIVTPAGLIENWRRELEGGFRLHFDVLGRDFQDHGSAAWERHGRVIVSIDTLKQQRRMQRLLAAPGWDLVVFDEAHHLSRTRSGKKTVSTQNYRLAEALRNHCRDMIFLSATPHQGNTFQFWSLLQLLNDRLFPTPEALTDHRGMLGRVMLRRTKREVTDARGEGIFRKRLVNTERFGLAPRERFFYDRLSEYLRDGYNAAGIDLSRTTSAQRAIGFVMVTFQKIMSSSPRAIRQALRRRLLVLLARKQLALEGRRRDTRAPATAAEDILRVQDEMLGVAKAILGGNAVADSEAEAYVGRVRRRLQKREDETETTSWSMDGDEEAEEGVYAEADIPEEIDRVRELVKLVPEGTDRRFETLARAVSSLRRENSGERFLIFTQYRDTLEFLAEELGRMFGATEIAMLKGGALDDKIAAMESFWREDGAKFLISTSAGGEGVNLQIGRVLFNYDLPWNPMAVEQRIGRIHRYGQQDTVQVYNLLAEDTVEERIYGLLESKLGEIAVSIGKVDQGGRPMEDFRSDILGLLGSRPDYQDLYKRALLDKDYRRTESELARMLAEANRAREALSLLSQDLSGFNLEAYRAIEGRHTLAELGAWVRGMILQLGGAALPDGQFWSFLLPESLQRKYSLAPRYEQVCFDRDLALRARQSELGGIGHPLVDALLHEAKSPGFPGATGKLVGPGNQVCARYLVEYQDEGGKSHSRVMTFQSSQGANVAPENIAAIDWISHEDDATGGQALREPVNSDIKAIFDEALKQYVMEWQPDRTQRARVRTSLIGLHLS
ncbi:MAG: DEAD/DEAH box helicase family protein [Rhodocyclales bacterium]|nr:DEAD/DEAH box helicase family protein [Rhodocyclales bacterium]